MARTSPGAAESEVVALDLPSSSASADLLRQRLLKAAHLDGGKKSARTIPLVILRIFGAPPPRAPRAAKLGDADARRLHQKERRKFSVEL